MAAKDILPAPPPRKPRVLLDQDQERDTDVSQPESGPDPITSEAPPAPPATSAPEGIPVRFQEPARAARSNGRKKPGRSGRPVVAEERLSKKVDDEKDQFNVRITNRSIRAIKIISAHTGLHLNDLIEDGIRMLEKKHGLA